MVANIQSVSQLSHGKWFGRSGQQSPRVTNVVVVKWIFIAYKSYIVSDISVKTSNLAEKSFVPDGNWKLIPNLLKI